MQTDPDTYIPVRFIRPKDACRLLSITSTTLWRWTRERDDFPKPIKLGDLVTVWRLDELEEFVNRKSLSS